MEKNKTLVGDILVEFCIIEHCIRSIVFEATGSVPSRRNRETFNYFYEHIDNRANSQCKSTDKIFKDKVGKSIDLKKLIEEICLIRHIAAHQTDALISGLSKLPGNEVLLKKSTSNRELENRRLESTILYEDEIKVVITRGRGWSSLLGNSYVGSAEDLHNDWKFYSHQFSEIFSIWNDGNFEVFDIDGSQIAEY